MTAFTWKLGASQNQTLLSQLRKDREQRSVSRNKGESIIKIQSVMRMRISNKRLFASLRKEVDAFLSGGSKHLNALDIFRVCRKLVFIYNPKIDQERLLQISHFILQSMESSNKKVWYVGLALHRSYVSDFIQQLKKVLVCASDLLAIYKPSNPEQMFRIQAYLRFIFLFTDYKLWKISSKCTEAILSTLRELCLKLMLHLVNKGFYANLKKLLVAGLSAVSPHFSTTTLLAALGIKPIVSTGCNNIVIYGCTLHTLTIAGLIQFACEIAPDAIALYREIRIQEYVLDMICGEKEGYKQMDLVGQLDTAQALNLLGNLVQLVHLCKVQSLAYVELYVRSVSRLVDHISVHISADKKSATSRHWHPILGWCELSTDSLFQSSVSRVSNQLRLLWNRDTLILLFQDYLGLDIHKEEIIKSQTAAEKRRYIFRIAPAFSKKPKLPSDKIRQAILICHMYASILGTLSNFHREATISLSCDNNLCSHLWHLVRTLHTGDGLKTLLDCPLSDPVMDILQFFSECTCYCISIQDSKELYEHQIYFTLDELSQIAMFLNRFLYNSISSLSSSKFNSSIELPPVLKSVHGLVMVLYERDCRKPFCKEEMWILKELKSSSFLRELDKGLHRGTLILQYIPHAIPFELRLKLFRKFVQEDRRSLNYGDDIFSQPSTRIKVTRGRILEDGFSQLHAISAEMVKAQISVRFFNAQGLEEPGIDQMGVFKEFLENLILQAFNPNMSLFMGGVNNQIYPSFLSFIHDNHLELFHFIGCMLGKAVYNGLIMELNFAPFFLRYLLQQTSIMYSLFDELPSFNQELSNSLSYIKHYEGDIEDLELYFSIQEDRMGQVVSYDLKQDGSQIKVNNENKISYVHLAATFYMHTQIKKQVAAFCRGFHSIIDPTWLSCFSVPELQKLIAGDAQSFDISDLKHHTEYHGGYHSSHRVISWLWDILANEFDVEERGKFLKFVTSCSKPPLMGFAHLHPKFSIRCVDLAEEDLRDETMGSVLRGVFSIKRGKLSQERLPTASTCFNLLKLPCYDKRSTLKDKLKYAINSNAGFELS